MHPTRRYLVMLPRIRTLYILKLDSSGACPRTERNELRIYHTILFVCVKLGCG
jgi:hypothetical protein